MRGAPPDTRGPEGSMTSRSSNEYDVYPHLRNIHTVKQSPAKSAGVGRVRTKVWVGRKSQETGVRRASPGDGGEGKTQKNKKRDKTDKTETGKSSRVEECEISQVQFCRRLTLTEIKGRHGREKTRGASSDRWCIRCVNGDLGAWITDIDKSALLSVCLYFSIVVCVCTLNL